MEVEILGERKTVPIMCKCRRDAKAKQDEKQAHMDRMASLNKLRSVSIMDKDFEKSTFENFDCRPCDVKYLNMARNYVERWDEMYEKNVGLLFWGVPGNGKTYLVSCIANALLDNLESVIVVNINGLLNRIKETYNRYGNESDYHIINNLKNAKLLIIDDIGSERQTDWTLGKLYEIIDSRYRDKKPVLMTTNLTPDELKVHLEVNNVSRIYDRIGEMCTPVNVKSDKRRNQIASEKFDIVSGLF